WWVYGCGNIRAKLLIQKRRARLCRFFEINDCQQWLIINLDQIQCITSRVAVVCNDNSDRITVETHFAISQWTAVTHTVTNIARQRSRDRNVAYCAFKVFREIDGHDTGVFTGRVSVNAVDASMSIGAAQYSHVKHAGEF